MIKKPRKKKFKDRPVIDKAMLISMVLGKALLEHTKLLIHELKVSEDRDLKRAFAEKQTLQVNLHKSYHALFKNADLVLTEDEAVFLTKQIDTLINKLW